MTCKQQFWFYFLFYWLQPFNFIYLFLLTWLYIMAYLLETIIFFYVLYIRSTIITGCVNLLLVVTLSLVVTLCNGTTLRTWEQLTKIMTNNSAFVIIVFYIIETSLRLALASHGVGGFAPPRGSRNRGTVIYKFG